MRKELKPCPFCGGKPIIKLVGDNRDYFVYSCEKCHKTPVHQDEARLTRWGAVGRTHSIPERLYEVWK